MILALCLDDLKYEKLLNACMIAAITAVLAPLLLLFSLRYGILTSMERNLNSNPQNLEIKMLSAYELDENFFKSLRADPNTGFVVEMTRALSVSADVSLHSKVKSGVECIPTAIGDPVFEYAQIPFLTSNTTTAVSEGLALALDLKIGDVLRLSIQRIRAGVTERSVQNFKVVGVIPGFLSSGYKLYLQQEILTAMEDYRDGYEPLFFADGSKPNSERKTFAKARLYAKDLESVKPLSKKLSEHFNIADKLADIEELKHLSATLNFIFITVATVSVLGGIAACAGLIFAGLARKERSLALLRAEGFSQGNILSLILLENFLLASVSFVISVLLYSVGSKIFAVYFASSLKDGMVVSLLSSAHFCYFYVFTVVVALVISYVTLIAKILPAPLAQILRR